MLIAKYHKSFKLKLQLFSNTWTKTTNPHTMFSRCPFAATKCEQISFDIKRLTTHVRVHHTAKNMKHMAQWPVINPPQQQLRVVNVTKTAPSLDVSRSNAHRLPLQVPNHREGSRAASQEQCTSRSTRIGDAKPGKKHMDR